MSLPRPFRGYFCHSFRAGTKSMHFMPAARASPEQAVPDAAIAWTTSATPTYTACMGFDSVEAMRRYRSLFRSSVSAEHSHNDQCNSCENGTLASAHPCRKDRHQTCRQQGCPQPGERNSGAAESAVIKLQQNHDSVLHKEDQSKAGRVTDFVGHDDSSGRRNDRVSALYLFCACRTSVHSGLPSCTFKVRNSAQAEKFANGLSPVLPLLRRFIALKGLVEIATQGASLGQGALHGSSTRQNRQSVP